MPDSAPPFPTRFGWGMRLFLSLLLFHMVFRSFSVCYPWGDWADELDMDSKPRLRLPTRAEWADLPSEPGDGIDETRSERVWRAADSLWDFWRPWPEASARAKIHTRLDGGKWALAWLSSRMEFVENLVGVNEEWPMFSPSVGKFKQVPRGRLVYADGSERIVRGRCDPDDLTRYSHWFDEKILDYELAVRPGGEGRAADNRGYCNLLAHRHAVNDAGSPLVTVYLFMVRYDFPPPGEDAREWLLARTGPPAKHVLADFFEYDVATRDGKILLKKYDD